MTTLERGQVRPSETAEIVCTQRAGETRRRSGKRVLDDPYARHFISRPLRRGLVGTRLMAGLTLRSFDRLYPGFMAIVLLRDRWYQDVLADCLDRGIDQVVLLGAGYDTSAWRLDLGAATVFEVDAPPTQDLKRDVLARRGLAPRARLRYVPCDFERDSLPGRLAAHGFDRGRPSLVVWYGVSFFLSAEAVARTLRDVESLSAPGSTLVWDYLDPEVVAGTSRLRGAMRARAAVAARGEPYTYGLRPDEAEGLMARHGFRVEANLPVAELARRYPEFDYRRDSFFAIVTGRRCER